MTKAEAVVKARRLSAAADRLFQAVQRRPELGMGQVEELARQWFRKRSAEKEAWRARFQPEDDAARQTELRTADGVADGAVDILSRGDIGVADGVARDLLQDAGLCASGPAWDALRRAVLRAAAEIAQQHAAALRGHYSQPTDPMFTPAPALPVAFPAGPVAAAGIPAAAGGLAPPALKFTEAWTRYVDMKVRTRAWQAEALRENSISKDLFLDWSTDKPVNAYSRADISDYVAGIAQLPAMRGKDKRFADKSLRELADMTMKNPAITVLSPKSVKKHSANISSFFKWCKRQGWIVDNIAEGVYTAPKKTRRASDERAAWSAGHLLNLFKSPIYTGCKSEWFRLEPGDMIVKDAKYWVPMLLAFHPLRLEEACQLRVEDVKQEAGIFYLDVRGDDGDEADGTEPGRKVKSLAAVRRIPLHKIVLDAGFLQHVQVQFKAGRKMVFPELEPGGVGRRYGYGMSKWWPTARRKVGCDDLALHGLRHTVITAMKAADLHPLVMAELEGHETTAFGEMGRYAKNSDLAKLKKAIDAIAYDGIASALFQRRT